MDTPTPVRMRTRFFEQLIDSVLIFLIIFPVGLALGVVDGYGPASSSMYFSVIESIIIFFYYWIFETMWQRTPGKMFLRTKVVDYNGKKPSRERVLGRTFARCIPFEAFSFLFNRHPMGWHDTLSGTLVVSASYSDEQIKAIPKKIFSRRTVLAFAILGTLLYVASFISAVAIDTYLPQHPYDDSAIESSSTSDDTMQDASGTQNAASPDTTAAAAPVPLPLPPGTTTAPSHI